MRGVANPFRRGLYATIVAAAAVAVEESIRRLPDLVSPSSPPVDLSVLVFGLPLLGGLIGLALAFWVVPVNAVVSWVTRRRHVQHRAAIVFIALLVALGVSATLLLPCALVGSLDEGPVGDLLTIAAVASLFVVVWFLAIALMTPPLVPGAIAVTTPTVSQRIVWTSVETLSIVGIFSWSTVVAALVLFIVALGAGGDYRVRSSALSPDGATRAHAVDYLWGGAAGGIREEVYLVPAPRRWSPQKRGLLVWQARHANTPELDWQSAKQLIVRVPVGRHATKLPGTVAFPRSGYEVRSEFVRTDSL